MTRVRVCTTYLRYPDNFATGPVFSLCHDDCARGPVVVARSGVTVKQRHTARGVELLPDTTEQLVEACGRALMGDGTTIVVPTNKAIYDLAARVLAIEERLASRGS